jgi:hypothetical protein
MPRSKPAVAKAANELQIIEQFGRPLAIQDNAALQVLQTATRHIIFITPVGRGRFEVHYGKGSEVLLVSRQPLLDTARVLIRVGCRPDAIIAMRRQTSISDDLRAPLGIAAKLTVDETRTVFAKWKPFSQSAVFPANAGTVNTAHDVAATQESSEGRDRRQINADPPACIAPAITQRRSS